MTAELLVDGLPLARLPREYMRHPMYSSLFGKSTLEAIPDTTFGLEFSAKSAYRGYQLRVGMQGSDMLVNASQNGENFYVLPQRLFGSKFPTAFIEDFIHWYNGNNNEVEFRPRDDPWSTNSTYWRLKMIGSSWCLTKPGVALLNMHSNTVSVLSKILSPLDNQLHIHALFDKSSKSLHIEMPRLQLGFHLEYRGTQIHSRQYRGMFIDPHQGLGALAGLSSKLILKRADGDRLVLVPEGSVTYSKTVSHIAVCIDKNTVVKVHAYQIDTTLGRLVDNGSLQSKLFLCYLHALTSYCLPDPLTEHTGTETAISILRSGAVRSFEILTKENVSTLELIARLAPKRLYYPRNERVMQEVGWDCKLHFLSQSPLLYTLVEEIFEQARMTRFFYPPEIYTEPPVLELSEPHLLQRDLIRTSTFRVSGFGAEHYSLQCDVVYKSRDRDQTSARGQQSFVAATLILRDRAALHAPTPLKLFPNFRQKYFSQGTIYGPGHSFPPLRLNLEWLRNPLSRLPALWCSLHSSLATCSNSHTKFDVMMWLSTVAFSETADMSIIEALAAFYRLQELKDVDIPEIANFRLSEGDVLLPSHLRSIVQRACRPFHACPEASLPKQNRETENQCRQRRASQFKNRKADAVESFAQALQGQWPCNSPKTPTSQNAATYIDVSRAMALVSAEFKTWHDNRCFYKYLEDVTTALARQKVVTISIPQSSIISFERQPTAIGKVRYFSVKDIFSSPAPHLRPEPRNLSLPMQAVTQNSQDIETQSRLINLCRELQTQAESKCEKEYASQLEHSFVALQESLTHAWTVPVNCGNMALLHTYLENCREYLQYLKLMLDNTIKGGAIHSYRHIAARIQHSPRTSLTFWLRQLNGEFWAGLSEEWKTVIIKYGRAITELQRAHRLLNLSESPLELADEFRNSGHQNWDPSSFPESLLLEAESGIMIREVQEEIARQMRSPPNGLNSVMQLNMGEGKSTVIVPIVAAALADGSRYVSSHLHNLYSYSAHLP